jgi:hypothetical protein
MQHGIICPTAFLEHFATRSKFHLILPHLIKQYKKYFEFYRNRAKEGDFILLDNSIFELGYSLNNIELLEIAESIHASEIVAPEVWHDKKGTIKLVEKFISYHDKQKSNIRILAMATGESEEEIIETFFEWNKHPKIDSLGLPFSLDYEIKGVSDNLESLTLKRVLNRWHLVNSINKYAKASSQIIKPTHLMGLSDAVELQRYRGGDYYWIRSNDSSTAFVHGYNLIKYTKKGLPCEKISQKVGFDDYNDVILIDAQISLIEYNIQTILDWCK